MYIISVGAVLTASGGCSPLQVAAAQVTEVEGVLQHLVNLLKSLQVVVAVGIAASVAALRNAEARVQVITLRNINRHQF